MSPLVSILILTKNEQKDLPACLQSVTWSDDIHVLDSFSSDDTCRIAERAGAQIWKRDFDNWANHQNWAVRNIKFKHPWVFYIDADERITPELKSNLLNAVNDPGDKVAFRVQRRDFLMGTWLKHVQASPYYLRLFRPEKMVYRRIVHVQSHPNGPVGDVKGYLDHFPFSKGMAHWIDRHNGYSSLEAQLVCEEAKECSTSLLRVLTERDFHRRREMQKALFYRLPARPLLKFLVLYLGKRGFLDGRAGLTYAVLQSIYEYFIVLKTHEHAARQRTLRADNG